MAKKDFIKDAIKRPGALRKAMGAKKGEPISRAKMEAEKNRLQKKSEGDKKLSPSQLRRLRQIALAQSMSKFGQD